MNLTSLNFNQNNQILSRHKILHNQRWKNGDDRDVIDTNHDGVENYTKGGFGTWITGRLTYTSSEPTLVTPYTDIKKYAKANNCEVVTQEDLGELKAKDSQLVQTRYGDLTCFNRDKEKDLNVRTLTAVAKELNPFPERPAHWAIDTTTSEFVIYSPKAGNGNGPLAILD